MAGAANTRSWLVSFAHSSYHALQATFRRRYRGGLQMQAAYTWSKLIDDFSTVGSGIYGQTFPGYADNNRRDLDRALSSLDIAQHLAVNFQYEPTVVSARPRAPRGAIGWRLDRRAMQATTAGGPANLLPLRMRSPVDIYMA